MPKYARLPEVSASEGSEVRRQAHARQEALRYGDEFWYSGQHKPLR